MKITQFDKQTCRTLGTEIEQALQKVAKEFGVSIKRKSGSYSSTNYTVKIEASIIGQNGIILSRKDKNLETDCQMFINPNLAYYVQ